MICIVYCVSGSSQISTKEMKTSCDFLPVMVRTRNMLISLHSLKERLFIFLFISLIKNASELNDKANSVIFHSISDSLFQNILRNYIYDVKVAA